MYTTTSRAPRRRDSAAAEVRVGSYQERTPGTRDPAGKGPFYREVPSEEMSINNIGAIGIKLKYCILDKNLLDKLQIMCYT